MSLKQKKSKEFINLYCMITKTFKFFSSKKSKDFFWKDINQGVKAAEYAVRGIVPMTAASIRE
jgi:hypothetical protein